MSASSTSKYPQLDDKALPDAPEILTPLRKNSQSTPFFNRNQPSPFLSRTASPFFNRRWSHKELTFQSPTAIPSDGRPRWIFTLPALVIALLTFLMATMLLVYLVAIRRVPDPSGSDTSAIYVSELTTDTLVGLAITTVATHMVSISVPFLISIAAYCVAGKWLREQEFPRQTRVAFPTPLQYGFMIKMLATSKITSVIEAGRYYRESKRTIQFPLAFQLALWLTTLIFGLAYSLILADIWLHGASSIVQGTFESTVPSVSFGVAFNESVCTSPNACLNDTAGWAFKSPWVTQSGLLVAANGSTALSVVTLNNASDLAVIVPSSPNASLTPEAPSFGVRAQCASLTPNCTSSTSSLCPGYPSPPLAIGGNTTARTNGTSTNATNTTNTTTVQPVTKLTATGKIANPQTVLVQLRWSTNATMRPANPTAIQTSGGDILAWASCNFNFYNLTLRQQDGNYNLVENPILADSNFATVMQGGLLSQMGNLQLLSNLQATMLAEQNISSAVGALNRELSRLALALFAGTLQPVSAAAQTTLQQSALFGRYPLPPVIIYLFLLYAYSLTAGGIYIWAARLRSPLFRSPGYKTTSAVQLAQLRLTDPLALVAALYPSSYSDGSVPDDTRDLFVEDATTPRLAIGTDDGYTSPGSRPAFGVYKRAAPRSSEYLGAR